MILPDHDSEKARPLLASSLFGIVVPGYSRDSGLFRSKNRRMEANSLQVFFEERGGLIHHIGKPLWAVPEGVATVLDLHQVRR